jgi:SOS-response transcriptional repressor LexA
MPTWHDRLRQAMKQKGWSAAELARRAGVNKDLVYKYLGGNIMQPRGSIQNQLAAALDVPVVWLREGFTPADLRSVPIGSRHIPVIGEVAGGIWLEAETAMLQDAREFLPFSPDPNLPETGTYALKVRGDSIDKVAPEGSILICVDIFHTGEIEEGDLVIVEQEDVTGKIEVTAKFVRTVGGTRELVPESSNPRWKPVPLTNDNVAEGNQVRVRAKVEYIVQKPTMRRD